jgi:hypothetical protein
VSVGVRVGVEVGVSVLVGVHVGVGVSVGVLVGVSVGVLVGVGVGVLVGVGVAVCWYIVRSKYQLSTQTNPAGHGGAHCCDGIPSHSVCGGFMSSAFTGMARRRKAIRIANGFMRLLICSCREPAS